MALLPRNPTGRSSVRRSTTALTALILLIGLALAGCGSARPTGARAGPPSPAVSPGAVLTSSPGGLVLGPTGSGELNHKVVAIDPGHNGLNYAYPNVINQLVWNGREYETCDTTGTATNAGYTEALFNWNVAWDVSRLERVLGATVVLTRPNNSGVGPCVTTRAAIGNAAHANVFIDIHADGGPPGGVGFTVLYPVADGPNNAVIYPSEILATQARDLFRAYTGEPFSNYDGVNALQPRNNLAGLNLTTVPKVLIETANMRNATDAGRVSSAVWQERAAQGIAAGLDRFLTGR
jgi:N-acetylmuramoyl-L-alanine amidase